MLHYKIITVNNIQKNNCLRVSFPLRRPRKLALSNIDKKKWADAINNVNDTMQNKY